jgi:hypothetical protein
MEFGRLASGIVITDDDPQVAEVALAVSRARRAADAGDYVGAIRLLGDVKLSLTPAEAPGLDVGVKPEDVEQALGDLRRALAREGEFLGREDIQALQRAAREAASEGRWEAAWALVDEADQRLGERLAAKGSRESRPSGPA